MECARLVNESGERLQDTGSNAEAARLYEAADQEFPAELALLGGGSNRAAHLESVYTVHEHLWPPLTDGYHFG
jgi:hypothetical protein